MIGGMGLMVCVCVALLMVWWFVFMCGFVDGLCLCLCVCVCGDGFGQVDRCIMGLCVALCVEPELEVKGRKRGCWKAQENVMNHAQSEKSDSQK